MIPFLFVLVLDAAVVAVAVAVAVAIAAAVTVAVAVAADGCCCCCCYGSMTSAVHEPVGNNSLPSLFPTKCWSPLRIEITILWMFLFCFNSSRCS